MHDARVLVIDDSAAMRALFSDFLEQAKNVKVVGTAAGAAEAREKIEALQPNVLTLDVEMPGISGLEFLAEVMSERPMPVVMLSSLTQSGSETSLKAFELGAVECFPKPLKATPDQFSKTVGKLGKVVHAAANSNVRNKARARTMRSGDAPFNWNGHLLAVSASMGGIEAVSALLETFPANCPPTLVVLQTDAGIGAAFIDRLSKSLACTVRAAADGATMSQGTIYIAADPERHVAFEPGQPPRMRLIAREPVDGCRPSADLLFGTLARAGVPAVGAILSGLGADGAKGLKLMRDAGCRTFAQDRAGATVAEAPAAAIALGAAEQELPVEAIAEAALACCSMN